MSYVRTFELGATLHSWPPRFVDAPSRFDGGFDRFWRDHVVPNLPDADSMRHYHDLIRAAADQPDSELVVRMVSGVERRQSYLTNCGVRIRPSDNAPAWWLHALLVSGLRVDPADASRLVDMLPCHMFDLGRAVTINRAGFHVAHILGAKNGDTDWERWDRAECVRRFVRNLHPCNVFPIAKIDWQSHGGRPAIIGFAAARYAERYGRIWTEFLQLAGNQELPPEPLETPEYCYPIDRKDIARVTSVHLAPVSALSPAPNLSWTASRLRFFRDRIEPLGLDDRFEIIVTGGGAGCYRMTKREFYEHFANVVRSRSYQETGYYHYSQMPERAGRFRV